MASRIVWWVLTLGILAVFHLLVTKEQSCRDIGRCKICRFAQATVENCLVVRSCFIGKPNEKVVCIEHDQPEENRSCGIPPPVNYIVGGSPTNEGDWPWQVSLFSFPYLHMCAGVLIDKDWVLTAAHCVDGKNITDLFVVLGEFDLKRRSENEQLIWIKQIIVHPHYIPHYDLPNDVALIQLESDAHYNDYVTPICLPSINDVYPTNSCSITGWGETLGTGDRSRLRVLNVNLVDKDECEKLTTVRIRPQQICAHYGPAGSCHGDSGGPLSCVRSSDGRFVVAGVASGGYPTCRRGSSASIYTNITTYVPWINNIMNSTNVNP